MEDFLFTLLVEFIDIGTCPIRYLAELISSSPTNQPSRFEYHLSDNGFTLSSWPYHTALKMWLTPEGFGGGDLEN